MSEPIDESRASRNNKNAIQESNWVGCYYCLNNHIKPEDIVNWCGGKKENTAICPHCHVDSILPNSPTKAQLEAAHEKWFT